MQADFPESNPDSQPDDMRAGKLADMPTWRKASHAQSLFARKPESCL